MPYVLGFAGVLFFAEILWRIGIHCLNRLDGRGIENLYVIGMDELMAKDAAFFHDNFAGSLTKRVLSFASRFEDFADNLVFNIVGSLVPLVFASVVLWRYGPLLVAGLIGLIAITGAGIAPLIRRRQKLVDQREEAIARVSGHVADSLMNMDTIRAFAAEDREAAEHRSRVADQRRKSVRSWDYANLRIDALVAPASVLTNVLGLLLAVALGAGQHGIEAIIVAFTYYSNATRIMFEFNQIYRQLESSLTEAAQFTALLLTSPTVVDPIARKYGPTLDDVIAFGADVTRKLSEIENKDEILRGLRAELAKASAEYMRAARALSKKREDAARKLERLVEAEINDLAMKSTFQIQITTSEQEGNWSASGIDQVVYMIATNPGEPVRQLEHIASGGELSRVMLALKVSVEGSAAHVARAPSPAKASATNPAAHRTAPRTMVFDEIDTGIGGRAAEAVGKKLKSLARSNQVLCVTHLPQIATFADHHYVIEKKERSGRTRTSIRAVAGEERTEEVARMLSGAKLTDTSRKHAEQMIKANGVAPASRRHFH